MLPTKEELIEYLSNKMTNVRILQIFMVLHFKR